MDRHGVHDPLTQALLVLAAHHGRAITRSALLAGLPIENNTLTPELFIRAAARAGLEAQRTERALADIPDLVCPVPLLMRDGTVRILHGIDPEAGLVQLSQPGTGHPPQSHALADIATACSGVCYLVRPAGVDPRVSEAGDQSAPHWFWSVISKNRENYGHVALSALLLNLLALASPLFFMNVYDRVIPNGAIASLVALSIGMVLALVFDFVLRLVRARIIDVTGKKIDAVLSANIFEHVMAIRLQQKPASVGVLANQLRDFEAVREFFTSSAIVSLTDLLFALLFIAILFTLAGPLAFIPLAMLPVMVLVGLALQRPLDVAMRRLQAEASVRHSVLVEALGSVETVRATGAEARMQTQWERSVAAAARTGEDVTFWSSLALTASNTAQQIVSVLTVIIGVFLILKGDLTVGALIASSMLAGRVLAPIAGIAGVMTRATQTLTSLRAIDRLMTLERERPAGRAYVARTIARGEVVFDKVSFRYPQAETDALSGVSFRLRAGEKIGVIGRIGSGKTTIGRLLDGFYDPSAGRILIDGVDIRQYDPADLRSGVGFVLQDTDLFYGTVRENITLGLPGASDAEVLEAARLAGVEAFVAAHPLGYDMRISEGGRSLSGGQKQAIGLARALIRKPKILFLDEPTAHFDVRSEAEFLQRLEKLAASGMTLIISTHRLSVLTIVDRLLVVDQGRLTVDGPRDQVLAALRGEPAPATSPRVVS